MFYKDSECTQFQQIVTSYKWQDINIDEFHKLKNTDSILIVILKSFVLTLKFFLLELKELP
jgi:uncharacterized membrane protein (UPF0182 family)